MSTLFFYFLSNASCTFFAPNCCATFAATATLLYVLNSVVCMCVVCVCVCVCGLVCVCVCVWCVLTYGGVYGSQWNDAKTTFVKNINKICFLNDTVASLSLTNQKPIAQCDSAWCPGGRTTARPLSIFPSHTVVGERQGAQSVSACTRENCLGYAELGERQRRAALRTSKSVIEWI